MGRKLQFLPTCGSPSKTLSFRAVTTATAITGDLDETGMTQENESSIESVIKGLSSDRFFFNPGKTSSILEEAKPKEKDKDKDVAPFKENVSMMEMESTDPFVDFKKSMQEMVEADEGLKQWDNLQELLSMYLSLNDKINHGYIIRAFVDILLVNLGPSSSSSTSTSSSCSSSINGQVQSLLNGSSSNDNKTMNSHESPESTVSFTSSSASTSETCSSTSHCLSSCSLEDDDVNHEDDEDLTSPQKVAVVSDDVSVL
nr:transcription repressor OFP15-like [Tanacetum cinerariifolium]GEZ75442.1 transcription repressor OFP15-like [Tanacetum cinerariifolium]